MKKYLIIAFLFFSTLSFAQTGIGWGPIRYKVNFRDTINIDVAWMVHDTTILTSAKAINYLQGATSNVQTQISNKQDIPVNYAPTVITFGNATQNYDITGTTWVAATAGIPDAVGHLLPAALTSIATAYDGEYLAIREAAGVASATNPLTVQFTFPTVATFNVIKFRSIYVGSASHDMVFELYNGATWDIFTVNSIESSYVVHSAEVLVPATYIIGGTVLGRFRHEQTGNTGHHLDIDFIVIASGGGSGGAHTQSAIQTPSTAIGDIAATNVQAAIEELENEKLAIADTATMLGHYIERTDTASMLLSYAKDTDVALKLNISDTALMLNTYIQRTDTAAMLLSYAKDTDVALKLTKTDTTAMLANYIARGDTASMLDSYAHTNNPTFYTGISTPAITLDGTLVVATGPDLNMTSGGDSNFQEQINNIIIDTIPIQDITKIKTDTIPIATFGLGSGQTGDTIVFQDNALIGSFYNRSSDTLAVTSLYCVLAAGSGTETIGVNITWSDTLKAVVPTKLNTAAYTVTSMTIGNEDTSFNNSKIPPGKWIWGYLSGTSAGNRPSYLNVTLSGYRISNHSH